VAPAADQLHRLQIRIGFGGGSNGSQSHHRPRE
jgi:hypothetical protein